MNGKKLAALAFVASLAATTLPSYALVGTVTVKWNTQAIANMTLTTQASASVTHTATEPIFQLLNGGAASGCNGLSNGVNGAAGNDTAGAAVAGIVNFGNVTPDSVQWTDCMETNAVNAFITTNDTNGYNVKVQATAGTPANYALANGTDLCLLPNGVWANGLAYTGSVRAAAVSIVSSTVCPGGDFQIPAASQTTILTSAGSTVGTNLNADMELAAGPNIATSPVAGESVTVTYTLTTL